MAERAISPYFCDGMPSAQFGPLNSNAGARELFSFTGASPFNKQRDNYSKRPAGQEGGYTEQTEDNELFILNRSRGDTAPLRSRHCCWGFGSGRSHWSNNNGTDC